MERIQLTIFLLFEMSSCIAVQSIFSTAPPVCTTHVPLFDYMLFLLQQQRGAAEQTQRLLYDLSETFGLFGWMDRPIDGKNGNRFF
jgi:hypothetical protein